MRWSVKCNRGQLFALDCPSTLRKISQWRASLRRAADKRRNHLQSDITLSARWVVCVITKGAQAAVDVAEIRLGERPGLVKAWSEQAQSDQHALCRLVSVTRRIRLFVIYGRPWRLDQYGHEPKDETGSPPQEGWFSTQHRARLENLIAKHQRAIPRRVSLSTTPWPKDIC
jgi:hypothetical protein